MILLRFKTPAERLGQVIEKIEGHMTFYLEKRYQDSMSEDGNQKMECHMTLHLDRNFKSSQQM